MKWIKASERMPTETGRYFAKMEDGTNFIMLIVNGKRGDYRTAHEWLDESPTTPKQEGGEGVYQLCPKCNGGGRAMNMDNEIPMSTDVCDVCNGAKIITHPTPSGLVDALEKIREAFQWTFDNMGSIHTSDHFNVPANGIKALEDLISAQK